MPAATPSQIEGAPAPGAPTPQQRQSVLRTLRTPSWLSKEVLAGVVVAIALIPEAIAFSVIAGVDPRVGLFASFTMAVTIAIVGGRPAMISAATGAVALVIAPLVASHGTDYFVAAVILAGVLQILLGLGGSTKLMRFIPRSVMVGFVNALAILIFAAQVPELFGVPWLVYPLAAAALLIVFGLPKLTSAIPAPLVAIVLLTALTLWAGWDVPTVADKGTLPDSLPSLLIPNVPLTWETLGIIAPFSLGMALVGLMESLMTAQLVDDITDTRSNKRREAWGQGVANVVTGLFGGMGGCAMIGQTTINVKVSGARTRISTFVAGVVLLLLVVLLGDIVGQIPMAVLVAIMIFVCWATFDWDSIRPTTLRRLPRSETAVMLVTVAGTVATHNLAIGVVAGVLVACALVVRRAAGTVRVNRVLQGPTAAGSAAPAGADPAALATDAATEATATGEAAREGRAAGVVRYEITGPLLFASANLLADRFTMVEDPHEVVIDLSGATVWDASTVAVLDDLVRRYAQHGKRARIEGLSGQSAARFERLSGTLG